MDTQRTLEEGDEDEESGNDSKHDDDYSEGSESEDIDEDMDILALFGKLNNQNEDMELAKRGYSKIDKLCDSLQGEVIKAEVLSTGKFVAIKIVQKVLVHEKKAIHKEDSSEFEMMVEEDIKKEAEILKHLTLDNSPKEKDIARYIESFDSPTHEYLVTEYVEGITLSKFVADAFEHIAAKQLSYSKYRLCVRSIMLQLIDTVACLHGVYKCCHLDLCLDNVLVHNIEVTKVETDNGKPGKYALQIIGSPKVKLLDFGVAEIFKAPPNSPLKSAEIFECAKNEGLNAEQAAYSPPEFDKGDGRFDARCADMWSLGVMMFHLTIGSPLYEAIDIMENKGGYLALQRGQLRKYLAAKQLLPLFKRDSFDLLNTLLHKNPKKRIKAKVAARHAWFSTLRKSGDVEAVRHYSEWNAEERKKFPYYDIAQ